MRKLVTVRRIQDIKPIPDADAIEVVTIDGWKVVTKKGEFKVGSLGAYFEVDSFLPELDPRFQFLMKSGVREMDGVRGHVLRTVKLRGQLSQGLILPINQFVNDFVGSKFDEGQEVSEFFIEGQDLTEMLDIKKWEPIIDASLSGLVKGSFPSFIRKTDQERCQNLVNEIFEDLDAKYEVSLKMDGASVTYYHYNGEIGACSRNLELKVTDENASNSIVKILKESKLFDKISALGNIAIQGEIMGPGIQGNRENLRNTIFYVFDMLDLNTGEYLGAQQRKEIINKLASMGVYLSHVPVYMEAISLRTMGISNVDELLAKAEGPSLVNPVREGLVFKRLDGKFSFKAISNKYLLKLKE